VNTVDFRSDTVTQPSPSMREAMMAAALGDDVYGDDPSVNDLQEFAADLLGHESSLFLPTGTQSNLVALLTHCQRGDEYIVGADAHTYKYEGGGAAALGGIQPQPLVFGENGELDLQFAKDNGLAFHLDGARIANAATYLNSSLKDIGQCFDTVSLCLSKGLGAPIGSLLFGSQEFIDEARRWRKVTGGGMRQVGMLAAAGKIALTEGFARLSEDHENAQYLEQQLKGMTGVAVKEGWTQTNMVWLEFDRDCGSALSEHAKSSGVLVSAYGKSCRVVMHSDVDKAAIDRLLVVLAEFFNT